MSNKENNNLIDGKISLFHSCILKKYFNQETNTFNTRTIGIDENPDIYASSFINPPNVDDIYVPCEEISLISKPPADKVKVKKL